MTSYYISLGQVFSNEYFSFDALYSSAFSGTLTFATGLGTSLHYVQQRVNFAYTAISPTEAIRMGLNRASNFTSTQGIVAGRGVIPLEILDKI